MQTRLGSAIETAANIVVGFTINWFANMAILPMFGFTVSGSQAFWLCVAFTGISIVRSYALRRIFNSIKLWNTNHAND